MIKGHDLFSVRFFEAAFPNATDVLQEVVSKRKEIKVVSEATRPESNSDYFTDYSNPVKINAFEKGFESLQSTMDSQGIKLGLVNYWSAFYKRTGNHPVHIHKKNILSSVNYSAVLYLSNIGGTTFFAPSEACFDKSYVFGSSFGSFNMFPNTLLHAYHPGDTVNTAERVIMSCNLMIEN